MTQDYYKGLFNTRKPDRQYFDNKFNNIDVGTWFTPINIYTAIKELNSGKSCRLDDLSSKHYNILVKVVNCMIAHDYLHRKCMYIVIVPLVKKQTRKYH